MQPLQVSVSIAELARVDAMEQFVQHGAAVIRDGQVIPASVVGSYSSSALPRLFAFGVIYVGWGTTFLAIKEVVRAMPPALSGGVRYLLAGLILLAIMAALGHRMRPSRADLVTTAIGGVLMFMCSSGLLMLGETTVDSGVASILASTTPLWMSLCDTAWPWRRAGARDYVGARGWVGLVGGLGGVALLSAPTLVSGGPVVDAGVFAVLGAAVAWAIGSIALRHRPPPTVSHSVGAAYQMLIGGCGLTIIGLAAGELGDVGPESLSVRALTAFLYLLVVGCLLGHVAYYWLLSNASIGAVAAYAYVNPVVGVTVAIAIGGETLSPRALLGAAVVLVCVALVRGSDGRGTRRGTPRQGGGANSAGEAPSRPSAGR